MLQKHMLHIFCCVCVLEDLCEEDRGNGVLNLIRKLMEEVDVGGGRRRTREGGGGGGRGGGGVGGGGGSGGILYPGRK